MRKFEESTTRGMRRVMAAMALGLALAASGTTIASTKPPKPIAPKKFDGAAKAALTAMKARATQLNISGVAVVAFAPGETVDGWMSEMAVVGHMTDKTSEKGNNLLGIAYAKASEMARTAKDSGTSGLTPMTGEFGWQGGVVSKTGQGLIVVAFSGGKSEDDVEVSKAGLGVMKSKL